MDAPKGKNYERRRKKAKEYGDLGIPRFKAKEEIMQEILEDKAQEKLKKQTESWLQGLIDRVKTIFS